MNDRAKRRFALFCLTSRTLVAALATVICLSLPLQFAVAKDHQTAGVKAEAPSTPKEIVTIIISPAQIAANEIYVGSIVDHVTNPRCVDISQIVKSTPEYEEAQKSAKDGRQAQYWILMSRASDIANRAINRYAEINKIGFICKRTSLIKVLKSQEAYKDKNDEELIAMFDLTAEIISWLADKNGEKDN